MLITLVVLLFSFPMSAGNASAAGAEEARQFVDKVGKKVLETINEKAQAAQKQQQLRQLFSEHVDMEWMGKFVLAQGWAKATEDQRGRYMQAYRGYLLARYTTNFTDYAGSNYTITDVKPAAEGEFIVGMAVSAPKASDQEVQAGYRVHVAEGGQFKIIDIIIEGVSLLTTQRAEFASAVQQGSIDKLIEQLHSKVSVTN